MKITGIFLVSLSSVIFASCGETHQTDNVTHDNDTMVIKKDKTDSATNAVSTDTTQR
jgi:hypothetical protein